MDSSAKPHIVREHEVKDWVHRITVEKLEKALELIEKKSIYDFNLYCYSDLFVIDFGWPSWTEGREFVSAGVWDLDEKDELFCYRLNTALLRNDRFCEGVLEEHVNNGLLKAVFKRLIELKRKNQ